ncbi:hypothetical protein I4U23_005841 [Adineta vaga]|nr:hypothetical protein I4U23_005841 [Adineta vaga]
MVENLRQTNILLCGSARVGKSTLINAICQRKLTKTSESLNSVTKTVDRYSYECGDGKTTHETIIWDSPGIESWNENDVRSYMSSLIEQTQPLCMIYCASPGSFAVLEHVAWLVSECYKKNIFCALVCTNMWAGRHRQEIVKEFCRLLNNVHPTANRIEEDGIVYYGNVALVTMVNSQEYVDLDFDVRKPPSGVEELIFGIGKCLKRDLMFAWFRSVSQNTSFWTKMSSKLSSLLHIPTDTFNSLYEGASTFMDFLFDIDSYQSEYGLPIISDSSEENSYHDMEIIEMPKEIQQKTLIFTFKHENLEAMQDLRHILATLGASSSKTEKIQKEFEEIFTITTEFDNVERLKAIFNLCQLTFTNQITCSIEN